MGNRRPINRLVIDKVAGSGKAEVVKTPSQFSHILWVASKGNLGIRNVAIIWLLFGSGLRVNEVAHLKIKDLFYKDGSIKKAFSIPSSYTKTGQPRTVFLLAKQQVRAILDWKEYRLSEGGFLSLDGSYGGLSGDSNFIVTKHGKNWRKLAFNDKKYESTSGEKKTTKVCSSLENLVRDLLKGAGLQHGSSHSGRRTLATWLDRKDYKLELIQQILGHATPDMTLEYIDLDLERLEKAHKSIWAGVKLPE